MKFGADEAWHYGCSFWGIDHEKLKVDK